MNIAARALLATLAILASTPSIARDRPGTPNEGRTYYCAQTLEEDPAVCVQFQNTATEDVGFLMNWTINGELVPSDLSGRSECVMRSAQQYSCRALYHWFQGNSDVTPANKLNELIDPSPDGRFSSDREFPEAFRVTHLAYDTEYCFRFRAIDRFAVISAIWSGYTCVRTPPEPGVPAAPVAPKVTGLQPTSGAGVEGDGTPFKLLVEWPGDINSQVIGWYSIELLHKGQWIPSAKKYMPARFVGKSGYEGTVEYSEPTDARQRHAVRVCAHNVVHKACSPEAWYYAFGVTQDRLKPDAEIPNTAIARKPTEKYARNATPQTVERPPVLSASPASRVTTTASVAELDALAGRGAGLASLDALAMELRDRAAEGAARRGFDIGMAAAEGQTQPGPGKQKIHDSLSAAEQEGFDVALAYSLQRNANATRAAIGLAIANSDVAVAEARAREPDVFYWLGFDIASGIFGDPAAGAQGNTATGPGSLAIRNALNPAAQRGFNASVALHLGRKYR